LDFNKLGFLRAREAISKGECTCTDIVEHFLHKINEGKQFNAFISVYDDETRKQASVVQEKLENGKAGKLAGFVLAVKDNIVIKNKRVTCGSRILEDFVSPYNATVVDKLLAEDAIIIGKTNMDEFAMGSSNENSYFGAARNPHDPERVSGGSSGGSCVAVAAGMSMAALGSDTGGSIRQPASFCGVTGLKPTYGRVSRFGLVAFASSFDQIGPVTTSIQDAALLLEVICGHDPWDSTSAPLEVPPYFQSLSKPVKGLKVGLPKEYFADGLNDEVKANAEGAIACLEAEGVEFIEVALPHSEYAVATYYILATAEASSNLSRYDGARYGFRAPDVNSLEEMYVKSRSQGFGEEVKRRIMLGTYVLSAGYYDAYYRKAQKVRTLIRKDFEKAFEQCDCLLTPVAPTTAFKIGEKADDPLTMYLSDIYTVSVNLAGLPGMSIPFGMDKQGLPIGLQLIGKPFDEETLLRAGKILERASS
jgi:aspartyl-tRNA(Asn)/glutamyl-tRNA(Gln) amidotransferase subunit A